MRPPYKRFDTEATIAAEDYAYSLACELERMYDDPDVSQREYLRMEKRVKKVTNDAWKIRLDEASKAGIR